MIITIERAELARMMAAVDRVIENRNTIPILSHVLVQSTGDKLTIRGTDLDVDVTIQTPLIGESGSFCAPAKMLSDIAKKAGKQQITLEAVNGELIVKSGRSRFKLYTLPTEDFPAMNEDDYTTQFDADLSSLADATSFAISEAETRYYLGGMYLVGTKEELVAVATDGNVLSKATAKPVAEFEGIIVPQKMVGLLPKGACSVAVNTRKIRIEKDGVVVVSKLIDGQFPDYERVIPEARKHSVPVDVAETLAALDRVSMVHDKLGSAVGISVAAGSIKLSARSQGTGEADDELEVKYSGEPIQVGLNYKFLGNALRSFPAGEAEIQIEDASSPVVLKTPAETDRVIIIMPMRVS